MPPTAESFTILTANTRLARAMRRDFDLEQIAAGKTAWEPRDILPFGAWLERSWRDWMFSAPSGAPQLLRSSQELAIWEDIIERLEGDIDLLQVPATAESAVEAWNLLHSWQLSPDASEWADTGDTEAFRKWALDFRRQCETRGWISAAQLPDFIADRIAAREIRVPERVVLCGFIEWTPVQQKLIEALRSADCAVEIRSGHGEAQGETARRITFQDSESELRAAARWARRLLEEPPAKELHELRIGIVVPEIAKLRKSVERIFAEELHPNGRLNLDADSQRAFNISLGPNLAEYPLIQSAFLILSSRPAFLRLEEASRLVRSPFIAGAAKEATQRGILDVRLRRRGEFRLTASEIRAFATHGSAGVGCPQLAECIRKWEQAQPVAGVRQTASAWAADFSSQLRAIGWPGDDLLRSHEYQTLVAWNELLAEFARLDLTGPPLSSSVAVGMLRRLAASRTFQPESEHAPIQILGVLEAAGTTFDHLWIAGMHDGLWPPSPSPNPFLPLRLQRTHQLPHSSPQRELDFAQRITAQLLASSPDVVVSAPRQDGDAGLRLSPLFSSLAEVQPEQLHLDTIVGHAERLRQSSRIEAFLDNDAPPWEGPLGRGGTALFKYQSLCPFRAFVQVRLRTEPLQSAHPGLSEMDRGILVHDVFQRIWTVLGSHARLMEADRVFLDSLIRDQVQAALAAKASNRKILRHTRFATIEQSRLERLAAEWLEMEKRRRPFVVVEQEQERLVVVGGIEFKTRADRIDRLEDGTHLVLDYKTADAKVSGWIGPRPEEPQVPLYAITADVPLGGVLFGIARTGEIGFRGLTMNEDVVPKPKPRAGDPPLLKLIESWRTIMEGLAADFREGKASVDPKEEKSCRYCGLHAVCRIREANIADEQPQAVAGHE